MADEHVIDPGNDDNPSVSIENVDADQTNAAEATVPVALEQQDDREREARAAGWVPKEQWRGPPEAWRDAKGYLEARDHVLPLVRKENKALREALDAANARLARLEQAEVERANARAQLQDETLKVEFQQALENQDHARAAELQAKIVKNATERVAPVAQSANTQELHPVWVEFLQDNPWAQNEQAQRRLYEALKRMKDSGAPERGREALEEAKDQVKRFYPDLMPAARRGNGMAEGGGYNGASQGTFTRSWNDLKPEVRAHFESMFDSMPGLEKRKKEILQNCAADPKTYFAR